MARGTSTRTVLIGWDSANWDVITPLLDSGQLPSLSRLIERGVMAHLITRGPLLAPIVFNSVATGKYADKHGVLGPHEIAPDRTVRRVTGLSRRTKAFWEILSQNDRRCNIINFPITGPAETTSGVFVSPAFFRGVPPSYRASFDVPGKTVYPNECVERFKDFIVSLEDIDAETMALFVPHMGRLEPRDRRLKLIEVVLAQTLSVHAVATWVIENTDWDVTSVNYQAIDSLWRRFLRYHPPRLPWIDEQEFTCFSEVAASTVRLCDLLLGRLLQLAGEDTAVLVYSARGYVPRERLSRGELFGASFSPELMYRGDGVFVMQAPGGREDELVHGVSALDLCPMVLHLAGVAAGKDMGGRVPADAFISPPELPEPVASWDDIPPLRPRRPDRRLNWREASGFAAPYAVRPAWRVQAENDWNLARTLLASGRSARALPLLIRLYWTNPLQVNKAPMVAEALYVAGVAHAALAVMEPAADAFPDSPTGRFIAGLIALRRGQTYLALDLFDAAQRDDPPFPSLYYYLGQVCLSTGRVPRAVEAFTRAVETTPDFLQGHLGLSEALYRSKQYEPAAEAALRAIGVSFSDPPGHIALGKALVELGQLDRARQAFQTALRYAPGDRAARRGLAKIDGRSAPQTETDAGLRAPPQASAERHRLRALENAVRRARHEVAAWHSQFVEDLAAADRRLDEYLAENAAARRAEWPPESSAAATDEASTAAQTLEESEWTLRPALPSDQPALRQAFEDIFAYPYEVDVLVIHPVGTRDVQGVAAIRVVGERGQTVELRVSVGGKGVGSQNDQTGVFLMTRLLRTSVARAAAGGAQRVTCTFSADETQSALRRCLGQLGFESSSEQSIYTMSMAALRDRCLRLVERYERRKAIPEGIRLVSLREASYEQVDRFLHRFFPDGAGAPLEKLSQSISPVMFKDNEIIACYVGHRTDKETFVATRLGVLEGVRGLWVTPWLLGNGCKTAYEDGCRVARFFIDEVRYPEFAKIARSMKAQAVGRAVTMVLELAIPWRR